MALYTDKFFYAALAADTDIMDTTDGRIYNTARPTMDENEDRIPYVIITYEGMTNEPETKDIAANAIGSLLFFICWT